jgi:hypothetical protein
LKTLVPPLPPPILISKKFKVYDEGIRDIWESYNLQQFYFPILHKLIKTEKAAPFVLPSLGAASGTKKQKRRDTLGTISHILGQVTPQRSVISAVSQTEAFLQYLVTRILRDHPGRLLSGAQIEQGSREEKLLEIVIKSTDKLDMLDRIIEERVRALFYGAPR